MSPTKRIVIEVSSDDDDDNPLVTRRKIRKLGTEPQSQPEANEERDQNAFAEFLARALPTRLMPSDMAAYIHRESNIRLKAAKQDGVRLDEIFIGDDCLPAWSSMRWDPEAESLHCVIQSRLLDLQVSLELGDLLREEILIKGNRKLDEARQLGIALRDIVIGEGLLATWTTSAEDDKAALSDTLSVRSVEGPAHEGDLADDEMKTVWSDMIIVHPSVEGRRNTPQSEAFSFSSAATSLPSPPPMSDDATSADSGSSSDSEGQEDFDDVIFMNNLVDLQPCYAGPDSPNIVHDVEILGIREGFSVGDLEIYIAEDDEDLDELPEMEFAIDREGFEYYFGGEGAVEVEIPGVEVRCSGEIQEINSDESGLEDDESLHECDLSPHSPVQNNLQPHIRKGKAVSFDDMMVIVNSAGNTPPASNADVSHGEEDSKEDEEDEEDEEKESSGVNIEETEYGFKW